MGGLRKRNARRYPHPHASQGRIENQPARAALRLDLIRDTFGGYSLEGPSEGAWVADDGQVYQETSFRLEVLVLAERVSEARELFMRVGKQFGQRAIYLEVRDAGEIIDLD